MTEIKCQRCNESMEALPKNLSYGIMCDYCLSEEHCQGICGYCPMEIFEACGRSIEQARKGHRPKDE